VSRVVADVYLFGIGLSMMLMAWVPKLAQ
jgi:hypothetical protein